MVAGDRASSDSGLNLNGMSVAITSTLVEVVRWELPGALTHRNYGILTDVLGSSQRAAQPSLSACQSPSGSSTTPH